MRINYKLDAIKIHRDIHNSNHRRQHFSIYHQNYARFESHQSKFHVSKADQLKKSLWSITNITRCDTIAHTREHVDKLQSHPPSTRTEKAFRKTEFRTCDRISAPKLNSTGRKQTRPTITTTTTTTMQLCNVFSRHGT